MTQMIGQRELRNDNAEIMRRVEHGESFTVTRNGKPVADLVPHRLGEVVAPRRRSLGTVQKIFQRLRPVDVEQWNSDRLRDDAVFGADDPLEDAWTRRGGDAR